MEIRVKQGESIADALNNANKITEEVTVLIESGEYEVPDTVVIERDNISIKAENAVLKGSKRIYLTDCETEGNLKVIDLKKNGISDAGKFGEGPYADFWKVHDIPKPHQTDFGPGLELFYDNKLMPVSRYPKEGFIHIKESLGETDTEYNGKRNGSVEGIFIPDDEFVKTWDDYKNIMLIGYWYNDWATQRHMIESLDSKTGAIKVSEPYHLYGYRDGVFFFNGNPGGHFYAINVKNAITQPGEWCIDRENMLLYVYPFDAQEYIEVSCADDLFYAKGRKNIKITGAEISQCRKSGICFEECENVHLSDIKVSNVGAWGILGENCMRMTVEKCLVSLTGGGGISVNGGDRQSLTPSEDIIKGCTVHDIARWHKTYMAAIDISGVGCTVSDNYIYDVPHFGIVFAGNNHIMERNEINNACYESNDAGAIYSGRNWTFRGNIIRHNYIHDLKGLNGNGCLGIYFDDCMSSAEVYGNTLANVPYAAILLGGGRDFDIHDNVFINCKVSIMYDNRGATWPHYKNGGGRLSERLKEIDYKCDIWKNAYPKLYRLEEDNKLWPEGNSLRNNRIIGGMGFALEVADIADITVIENNEFVVPDCEKLDKGIFVDWFFINK